MPSRTTSFATLIPAMVAALAGTAVAVPPLPFPAVFELSSLDGDNGFIINGIDAHDYSGSVSSAGDVNGDGYDDLIIGAWGADPNGMPSAGESYVVFGKATGLPASFNLSTLNGTNGFVLRGIDADDRSGLSVSSAGDVNGDGIDDLIIGAYFADPAGQSNAGECYVVFGRTNGFAASIDLSTLDGTTGFVINGVDADDYSGISVAAAGDVNGDGVGDLIIGAHAADPNGTASGESYVVFGKNTAFDGPFAASFNLSTLDGSNGFVLNGIDASDNAGRSVSSAGDVNGDGYGDIIIGALGADPNGQTNAGESYVVFGKNTAIDGPFTASFNLSTLDGSNGFVINGIDPVDIAGISVASAGDINGDGLGDLIIGASAADPNGSSSGESYVVFGKNTAFDGPFATTIELSTLDGANGFVLAGIDANDSSGRSVSSAGDVNGDGYGDLIIGAIGAAPGGNSVAGESYVVFGKNTAIDGPFAASLNLSTLDGSSGFRLNGIDAGDEFGRPVSSVGDINGDGADDLIIGAMHAFPNGQPFAGESYVIFGRAPACAGDVNGDGDTNAADFVILAGNFGASVTPNTNGDLNGDGLVNAADFVILAGDFGCGS